MTEKRAYISVSNSVQMQETKFCEQHVKKNRKNLLGGSLATKEHFNYYFFYSRVPNARGVLINGRGGNPSKKLINRGS